MECCSFGRLEMHILRKIFPGTESSSFNAVGEESNGCLRHPFLSYFKLFARGQWLLWFHQKAAASVQVEYHNCTKESLISVLQFVFLFWFS